MSFFRLPKNGARRGELRKRWLAKIPRKNTPLSRTSYVCGIHFPSGRPDRDDDSPGVFLGKPVVVKRRSRRVSGVYRCVPDKLFNRSDSDDDEVVEAAGSIPAEEATDLSSAKMQAMVTHG